MTTPRTIANRKAACRLLTHSSVRRSNPIHIA